MSETSIKENLRKSIQELKIKESFKEKKTHVIKFINENITNAKDFIKENPILSIVIAIILVIFAIPIVPIIIVMSIIAVILVAVIVVFTVVLILFIGGSVLGLFHEVFMLLVPITRIATKAFTFFTSFYLISRTVRKSKKVLKNNKDDSPKYKVIIDSFSETLIEYISLICVIVKSINNFLKALLKNNIKDKIMEQIKENSGEKNKENKENTTTNEKSNECLGQTSEQTSEQTEQISEQQQEPQKDEETKKMD